MANLPAPLEPEEAPGTLRETEVAELWHGLTDLQQNWLLAYLSNGLNATEAVRQAGYKATDPDSCRAMGHTNRNHPKMRPLIEHACQRHMTKNEVLQRVTEVARASWEDFIRFTEDGRVVPDLEKAKRRGVMHLVDQVKWDTDDLGNQYVSEIKLKDSQKAQDQLLKATGAYDVEEAGTHVENLTINQWNQQLDAHLQGDESDRWPEIPDDTE